MRTHIFFFSILCILSLNGMNHEEAEPSQTLFAADDLEIKYSNKVAQLIPELCNSAPQNREIRLFVDEYMHAIISKSRYYRSLKTKTIANEIGDEFEQALADLKIFNKDLENQKDALIAQVRAAKRKRDPREIEIPTVFTNN